ncbi:MAG: translation initiation factor eIF-1A [Candidatus Nanohaloarchaeota archaeon QJJ-9]|nr:translation initiation factor eIF-1A [Candidatus Nanohaloarchaeota archaeon QJJ-9]
MAEEEKEEIGRVRTPDDDEVLGVVLTKLGYGRFKVYCSDGNERTARIPGSKRRSMWVKADDVVLIEPWDIQGDEKGEIVFHYSNAQKDWLENKGFLDELKEFL